MIPARSYLNASFLQLDFYGYRKFYASYQGRKAIKHSYPAVSPLDYNNDKQEKVDDTDALVGTNHSELSLYR